MKSTIGKVMISLLLLMIIMVINTPIAEAINTYSYQNKDSKEVLVFENVSPGDLVWYHWFYRHNMNANILEFIGKQRTYGSFPASVSINGSDFDTIKTWYKNFEKIYFLYADFALREIPARTFYYGAGAGHGLKEFKARSVYFDLVGDWTFHYCRNLIKFSSSEVIKTIGVGAFSECTALPNISLKGTEKISDNAFYNNTSLETIETDGALNYIGKYAFYNNNALTSAIHPNVVSLGDYAYAECDSLLNVEFAKLNHIGYGTFQNCNSLETGYFPVATYVDDYAFYNNSNLTTVTMPRVQTIDPRAFMNNTNLKSLSLPKLRVIKNSAFEGCSNLRTLTLGGTPPTEVGANAFFNLPSDRKIYVPENSRITYDNADGKMDGKWYGWLISPISTECDMLSFTFADFSPKITGLIANTHWVWITVPYGTDVSSLVPTIEISPLATIHPASGIAQDFRGTHSNTQSDLFHYTVRAQSDSDTKPYWIRVSEALGDKKDITNFLLEGNIQGTINQANQMIDFTMPHDTDLFLIIPTITISDGATISPNSGVAQDFTGPVEYTVTALDDSTKTYTVTAHLENNAPTLKSNVTNDLIVSGAVNTPYNLDLSTIFEDADGDPLTYHLYFDDGTNQTYNEVAENYTFTPTVSGQYRFTFISNDGIDNTKRPYNITLAVENTIPNRISTVAEDKDETITVHTEYTLDLTTIFEDADGDNLAYYAKVDVGSYTPVASNYTYRPNSVGTTTHTFKVNDGASDSVDTYTIYLDAIESNNTIPNRINTVSETTNVSIQLGETYTLDLDTIFEDLDGDSLSYTLVEKGNSSKLSNSVYTLTPNALGVNNLAFHASDAVSSSIDQYLVALIVNPAPINNPPNIRAGVEHVKVADHIVSTPYTIDLSTIFEDLDGDPLTYYKANLFDPPTQVAEIHTFTVNDIGVNTSGFTAFDGEEYSSNKYTLSLNVVLEEDYNVKPNRIQAVPATSSQSITLGNSYTLDLSTIFEDSDNDTLSYKVSINGAPPISASENYSITPTARGIVNLRFTANDGSEDSQDTYFVELKSTRKPTSSKNASSPVESDPTTVTENGDQSPIPSTHLGEDRIFEARQDNVNVKINGKALGNYVGRDVGLRIQRIDLSDFAPDIDGELLEDIAVFDISLMVDGLKTSFESDEPIVVEIQVDTDLKEHKVVAVYIDENGAMQIMEGILVDGLMRFTTYHLSNYTLMYVDKSFADIENHWAKEAIEALAARGLVNGIGDNLFNPNGKMTRAEFTTIMVRYFSLISKGKDNYSDIENDKWYTDYVSIAKTNGILPEIYEDSFIPNKAITREEMMYILYKSLEVTNRLGTLTDNGDRLADFIDSYMLSSYAIEGSEYLISRDVINGSGDGMFKPKKTSLRSEVVQMLYNMLKLNR